LEHLRQSLSHARPSRRPTGIWEACAVVAWFARHFCPDSFRTLCQNCLVPRTGR
jgi:hypothetical protein